MPAVISDAAFSYSEGTWKIISPAYVSNCSVNCTGLNAVIGLIWIR